MVSQSVLARVICETRHKCEKKNKQKYAYSQTHQEDSKKFQCCSTRISYFAQAAPCELVYGPTLCDNRMSFT